MITANRRLRRLASLSALMAAGAIALTACAGGASASGGGSGGGSSLPKASGPFTYYGQTENTTNINTVKLLASGVCAPANKAAPLKSDNSPGASYDQKLQLLVGQNSLSNLSMSAGTPSLMKQFIAANQVEDLTKELTRLGAQDEILPAAASVIQNLYGQKDLYVLPNELNVEGIWYNKSLFSKSGITPPATWDDLVAATKKLDAAGVQPIAADGKDGWNVTRWVSGYLFRSLGADALQKVADGKAKLTDPDYVKAADAVASLGKAGAFGKGVASTDYNGFINQFLTGKAGMIYNGSWALANFNDPKQNKIGAHNIGFLPFPAVSGGAGSVDELTANVGVPLMVASKGYNQGTAAWVKCIAQNYGDTALDKFGVISGFKLHKSHKLPALTQTVSDKIASTKKTTLWFEALFSPKRTTVAQQNAGSLANGSLSGADFMSKVQSAQ